MAVFRIRPEHLAAFNQVAMERFVRIASRHLKRDCPQETANWSDSTMERYIKLSIERAATLGFESEFAVIHFAKTWLKFAEPMFDNPDATEVCAILQSDENENDRAEQAWQWVRDNPPSELE